MDAMQQEKCKNLLYDFYVCMIPRPGWPSNFTFRFNLFRNKDIFVEAVTCRKK